MKRITKIVLTMILIFGVLPQAVYAQSGGFDIISAEEAYKKKIKSTKNIIDAYMIDIYNNGKPVLCIAKTKNKGYCSDDYFYNNGKLVDIKDELSEKSGNFMGDSPFAIGMLSDNGGTGGRCASYFAIDENNKV